MSKTTRNIIEINEDLCDGCGQCILDCAEGAITLVDGKAKVIADMYCDGLGACLGGCPTGALKIIQREADPYDEEAVETLLASRGRSLRSEQGQNREQRDIAGHHERHHGHHSPHAGQERHEHHGHRQQEHSNKAEGCGCTHSAPQSVAPLRPASCGCPGSRAQTLAPQAPGAQIAGFQNTLAPLLPNTHWPLKIRLMSPQAPFLRGAHLVVAADCAAFAASEFHSRMRPGKCVLIGCPKFEGSQELTDHLAELFREARPQSCTVVRMEVPCCQGLVNACLEAAKQSNAPFAVREVVVTRQGEIVEK